MDAPFLSTVKLDRVGNVGAGEQTLLQFFTPANLLRNNGDMIFVHADAILAANVNAKTTKLYVGGTVVGGRSGTDNNSQHDIRAFAYRRIGGSIWCVGLTGNLTTATQIVQQTDITVDFSAPIEIKLTGEAVSNNDIVTRVLRYIYVPVGSNFNLGG